MKTRVTFYFANGQVMATTEDMPMADIHQHLLEPRRTHWSVRFGDSIQLLRLADAMRIVLEPADDE